LETGAIVSGKFGDKLLEDKLIYFTIKLKIKRYADGHLDKVKARGCAIRDMLTKMPEFDKYSPTVSDCSRSGDGDRD
jgi:hypothetical protein